MNVKHLLQRIAASLFLLGWLAGCADTQLTEGGIGGTGISLGPITGFGSIIQNGVRYDVSTAHFYRDGALVGGQNAYQIGEIVTIYGTIQSDGINGVAQQVEASRSLYGMVTAHNGNNLTLLGQTVHADSLTLFHGFSLLTEVVVGNMLEVSGVRDAQGVIRASSITRRANSFTPGVSSQVLAGYISQVDSTNQTFVLHGLTIDYSQAMLNALPGGQPTVNQYVQVTSQQAVQNQRLLASLVSAGSAYPAFSNGTKIELEGVITAFAHPSRFLLNGQAIVATANTEYEHGTVSDLKLNAHIEVEGTANAAGELVAEEISIRQTSGTAPLKLEGTISSLDAASQTLTLMGNTLVVDTRTILLEEVNDEDVSIRFADLRVNDLLEVKAMPLANGQLLALRIDRETPDASGERELQGVVSQVDAANGTFSILGISILVNDQTEFESASGESLSRNDFFAALVEGESIVQVEGTDLGSNWLQANKLEITNGDD